MHLVQYVRNVAEQPGVRQGSEVYVRVDMRVAFNKGATFLLSRQNVYLTESIHRDALTGFFDMHTGKPIGPTRSVPERRAGNRPSRTTGVPTRVFKISQETGERLLKAAGTVQGSGSTLPAGTCAAKELSEVVKETGA